MTPTLTLLIALGLVVVGYQLFVTLLLVRSGLLKRAQLFAQLGVVWIVPLVGAALCHWFYRLHDHYDPSSRRLNEETLPDPLQQGPVNELMDG